MTVHTYKFIYIYIFIIMVITIKHQLLTTHITAIKVIEDFVFIGKIMP